MAQALTDPTRELASLLGGARTFRGRVREPRDMEAAIRRGLPISAFESFREALELSAAEMADLLGVATRTLARRRAGRRLSPVESDRLYRIAYVTWLARSVLGSLDKARRWLYRDNRALGGRAPVSVLDTEIGERHVEELLQRIQYGVYS